MNYKDKLNYVRDNIKLPVKELARILSVTENNVYHLKHMVKKEKSEVGFVDCSFPCCLITGFLIKEWT